MATGPAAVAAAARVAQVPPRQLEPQPGVWACRVRCPARPPSTEAAEAVEGTSTHPGVAATAEAAREA